MIMTITSKSFPCDFIPTVLDNSVTTVIVDDKSVQLDLWDTAGQEDYDKLRPLSYPQTDVFVICFSVASPSSFANVTSKWLPEMALHCPNTSFLLVGCKTDTRDETSIVQALARRNQTPVTFEEGTALARSIGACAYLESSSKTQKGLKEVFDEAARIVLSNDLANAPPPKAGTCTLL